MRLGAHPGPLKIETRFAIPDTTHASFRDDKALPQDCAAIDSDFARSALKPGAFIFLQIMQLKLVKLFQILTTFAMTAIMVRTSRRARKQ